MIIQFPYQSIGMSEISALAKTQQLLIDTKQTASIIINETRQPRQLALFLARLATAFCNIFFSDHSTKIAKNYLRTFSPKMQQYWPLLQTAVSVTKCPHLLRCMELQKWQATGFELELRQTNTICCRKYFRILWTTLMPI